MRSTQTSLSLKRCATTIVAIAAMFSINSATAENKDAASGPASPKEFVKGALEASEVELRAGKMAQEKGQNAAVKYLGETVVKDQKEIQTRLGKIAEEKQIRPQEALQSLQQEHENQLTELQEASGADFDRMFITQMVRDHERDLAMLKEFSGKFGEDSEITQLMKDHQTTVEKHLRMAQTVASNLGIQVQNANATGAAAQAETGARDQRAVEQEERDAPTRQGDGEVLGLPTSNNDGTILGVAPAPSRTVEAGNAEESYVAEELADGKIDEGVDNISEADQDTVAVPATSEREKPASEFIPDDANEPKE